MSSISAADVKKLRDRTNMPMMDCKSALTEAGGDMDKAVEILRKRHKGLADKKGERETAEGRIGVYIAPDQTVGALLELRCESAPSAKNEMFVKLANDLAKQAALKGAGTVAELLAQPFVDEPSKTVTDRINEVIGVIRENMKPARFKKLTGLVGSYVHHDGTVGVLIQVEGAKADPQLLRDVCMHITARNPVYARRDDVPKDVIAKETDIARAQIEADPKNAGKKPEILQKIAEGKLKTWYAENVLVEQPFVKEESKTVGDLLKSAGLKLVQFVRFKVGELS
jgi:elongation factor Ts